MFVADLIVQHLREAGVACIFGVPGGGSNLDLISAAGRAGMRFVLTATETAGALAAVAQAEVSGRPGACLTTLGPGVASVVNGLACASLERAPLLIFTDSYPATVGRTVDHQRIDHTALLAPVTKWSATLSTSNANQIIREALARATTHPHGPVHIECPADVAGMVWRTETGAIAGGIGAGIGVPVRDDGDASRPPPDVALFEALVSRARKPLFIVGLGARHSLDAAAIRQLCEDRRVPAMVTYKAKGVVADADPHCAGLFTNGAIERSILAEADLLIGVGLDPVELIPRPWTHVAPVVNVGPWAVSDRHVPFAAQLVTDVPSGMQALAQLLTPSTWDLGEVQRKVAAQRELLCPKTARLAAHRVVQLTADAVAGRARVTVDAGAHMFPATMLWPVTEPNGMLISNGLSTMGFALPAAIGAAITEKNGSRGAIDDGGDPVVALTGDGGLLMCVGELLTAVRERLRVITVVFNDASLSLIDIKQQQRGQPSSGVALGHVDWCRLAQSLGVAAWPASTEAELQHALAQAMTQQGPSLVDARIDPITYGDTLRIIRG